MEDDQVYVALTAALIVLPLAWQVLRRRFDPFAPIWMFLVGYLQIYVLQATSLREWALDVRGPELVTAANQRATWALAWYLVVYFYGPGKLFARWTPRPPRAWSAPAVGAFCPFIAVVGLYSSWMVVNHVGGDPSTSPELTILYSFPFMTMVGAILMIVTGRQESPARPAFLAAGLGVAACYVGLWMFMGKRSPSLIGVLSTVGAFYVARRKRPSWPVLMATAFVGALFVAVAIGWRNNLNYEHSVSGFIQYLGDFEVSAILKSLKVDKDEENLDPTKHNSFETEEYGGFLLMMDTVPGKSEYDYGANYLRVFSTFIPRVVWPEKPLYGREQWAAAWVAGSEFKRDETFTGPAIGILGATQLNGGAVGALIVLAVVAMMQRASYEYFRLHEDAPWVQAWWALIYYTAWYAVVADDPANWFYYNWGFTCMPALVALWVINVFVPAPGSDPAPAAAAPAPAGA